MNTPFPIPVVRAIIVNDGGQILLLKRANTAWGDNAWCLPGGKVDYGQSVADALAREILEETGFRLQKASFFMLQDSLPAEAGGMHCLNMYFQCRVIGELTLNGESSAFAWISEDDMDSYQIVFRNDEALRLHFTGNNSPKYTFSIDN